MTPYERDYGYRYRDGLNWRLIISWSIAGLVCLGFWNWALHKLFPIVYRVTR